MRVLLISLGFPKYVGDSTAPFMASIVRSLVARDHVVDVVLPHHPDFHYPVEVGFQFFPYRYSPTERLSPWGFGGSLDGSSRVNRQTAAFLPAVVFSLRRCLSGLLATHHYDVVHAHWLLPNAWVAKNRSRRAGVPLVVTLHGTDVAIAERKRFLRRLAGQTLSAAGAVTAVSDDLRRRAERLGADPSKIRTVHLGVDTEAFAPRELDPAARSRLGVPADAFHVVTVGRLIEVKGFRYLIEAVSRLEGVHLTIVGDGDLRSELEQLAKTLHASVTFAGNLDQPAVADAVAAADIVAVPSVVGRAGSVDGLPTTLLEALAAGRAVIASAVAGIPEVVTNGVNGVLLPEKDVDALARALTELRDQPELRERLGREARRRAVAELDWNATAQAFEQAYIAAGARRPY